MTQPGEVVFDPECSDQLAVADTKDVDLVDAFKPSASRRQPEPFAAMGARAFEVRHNRVTLGDQVDDRHFEVRKSTLKWAHPTLRDMCELASGKLVEDVDVLLSDRLVNQPPDQQFVLFGRQVIWILPLAALDDRSSGATQPATSIDSIRSVSSELKQPAIEKDPQLVPLERPGAENVADITEGWVMNTLPIGYEQYR